MGLFKKILVVTVVLLVTGLVAVELNLPGATAREATRLVEEHPTVEGASVKLKVFPGFKLLAGRVDGFTLNCRCLVWGGLEINDLVLEAGSLQADPLVLWRSRQPVFCQPVPFSFQGELTESGLNQFFNEQGISGLTRVEAGIHPEKSFIRGWMDFFGNPVQLQINGEFQVINGGLEFVPTALLVEETSLPPVLEKKLLERAVWRLDERYLPGNVVIEDLKILPQKVILHGRGEIS